LFQLSTTGAQDHSGKSKAKHHNMAKKIGLKHLAWSKPSKLKKRRSWQFVGLQR